MWELIPFNHAFNITLNLIFSKKGIQMKHVNLQAAIETNVKNKVGFSGENLAIIVEAIYADNGDKDITNDQINELCSSELKGKCTVPQLRGKAVSMGYYQKKTDAEKASEHGTSQTRKGDLVKAIEITLSKDAGSFESLGKAKKSELEALHAALVAASDKQDADTKA